MRGDADPLGLPVGSEPGRRVHPLPPAARRAAARATCCSSTRSGAASRAWRASSTSGMRDEWTIVELDAIDSGVAGDVRYPPHPAPAERRQQARRPRASMSPAPTTCDNVELFMQAGFVRYGEEMLLYRAPDQPLPEPMSTLRPGEPASARRSRSTRSRLDRLYRSRLPPRSPARGLPPARLGTPGQSLARPALGAHAHPAFRRRRRRSSASEAARRTPDVAGLLSDRRLEGGATALHSRHRHGQTTIRPTDRLRPVGSLLHAARRASHPRRGQRRAHLRIAT